MVTELLNKIKIVRNNERVGTVYIEFFIGDDQEPNKYWSDSSYYLSSDIFEIISGSSFEDEKGAMYNVCGPPIGYKNEDLKKIIDNLEKNKNIWMEIRNFNEFVNRVTHYDLPHEDSSVHVFNYYDKNWKKDLEEILKKIIEVNYGLIGIVQKCILEKKKLWVLGV